MIRIVTDSASDLDYERASELGVYCLPLTVSFGEESYKENVDISKEEFYKKLVEGSTDFPKTSQVSPYAFEQVFQKAKEKGDDIIAILLSTGLSGTYQSGLIAEKNIFYKEEGRCHIIDSRTASAGEQLLVEYAAFLRDQGDTAEKIVQKVQALRPRQRLIACVNTLEYLHKGGRISKAAAAIGTIIHVKPILTIRRNGVPEIINRVRGNHKAIAYILDCLKRDQPDEKYPIYIMYSYSDEEARKLRKAIHMEGYRVRMKHVINVGAVIGSHVGPGAYGVAYIRHLR